MQRSATSNPCLDCVQRPIIAICVRQSGVDHFECASITAKPWTTGMPIVCGCMCVWVDRCDSCSDDTYLDGTISKVVVAPCDDTAATNRYAPTAVGFRYDQSRFAADTVTMLRVDILKVDGTKLVIHATPWTHPFVTQVVN